MSNKKLQIIADLWATYARKVLPEGVPSIQIQETKRAFYAGAGGLFGALLQILDEDSEPTEQDFRVMDAIHHELEAFNAAVIAGRN